MRTIEITAYKATELDSTAQCTAYNQWLQGFEYGWYSEIDECRKALLGYFPGARLDRDGDAVTGGMDGDILSLKGKRLAAWLWNNVLEHLQKGKYRSMKTMGPKHKRTTHNVSTTGNQWRHFRSAVFIGIECPLTGMSVDCAALDPLLDFVHGIGHSRRSFNWIDRTGKKQYRATDWECTTLEYLLPMCFQAINKYVEDDIEGSTSLESFLEDCEANDWEFTEDGERI